jgi:hypothetical protein
VGYVIGIVVVLAIVIIAATVLRRRGKARAVTAYAPNIDAQVIRTRDISPTPILSPEATTQDIVNREFVADTSDDLLDPHNPHHAQWVRDHPDVETDDEYLADHPEDAPKAPEG